MDKTILIYLAALTVVAVVMLIVAVKVFGEQKVRNWLVWAVGKAEQEFGSGTGQLKLRSVYNQFIARFPKLSSFITFKRFSALVDEALGILSDMLNNANIAAIVRGDDDGGIRNTKM